MLVGRVVRHEVEDHAQPAPMHFVEQAIELLHRSEDRMNSAIIRYVIAEVRHGRGINWRDPDRIDTQIHQVIDAAANAIQIADSIPVAVLKRPRIDFINYCILPPRQVLHPTYYSLSDVATGTLHA